jgi:phospho-N-acetylmuramoyl-pentapeptide-transferase
MSRLSEVAMVKLYSMLQSNPTTDALINIALTSIATFGLAMLLTPLYTTLAYRFKWWRKPRQNAVTGEKAPVFYKLHAQKHKRNIPTMAGAIMVIAIAVITLWLNLDRRETWLPLASLVAFGGLGLIDDVFNVFVFADKTGGLKAKTQAIALLLLAGSAAWWFYFKLGYNLIHVPTVGDINIGWLYIPLFMVVVFTTAKAVSVTDGLDGLAGGLLSLAFGAYAIITFLQGNMHLAAFCATIVGALLAYTWFNIYPARFFMGQVGSTALGAALGVVAMLTNTIFLLPIIGALFVLEAGSSLIQVLSKKLLKRKIFLSAPIHHHFEAIGWPETKVTMRFWVLGGVCAVVGLFIAVVGGQL